MSFEASRRRKPAPRPHSTPSAPHFGRTCEVILKENFSWPSDVFAKDLSSWRNVLDAYGYKPMAS